MEGIKVSIDGHDGSIQLCEDPTVEEVFFYWVDNVRVEIFYECELVHGKLKGVPNFIAELTVGYNSINV